MITSQESALPAGPDRRSLAPEAVVDSRERPLTPEKGPVAGP